MKQCTVSDWERNTKNRYSETSAVHDKLIESIRETMEDGSVLEIGPQMGADARFLQDLGYDVTTVDYNNEAIRLLKQKGLKTVKADALQLPFPDQTFNFAYSQGLIEHFREPELSALMGEQKRVVKKGGYVLIDVPSTYSLITIPKQILILLNKWIVPWETQYSFGELKRLGEAHDLEYNKSYSWGYDRYIGKKVKNALKGLTNGQWETIEDKYGKYFMNCIGIVFQRH